MLNKKKFQVNVIFFFFLGFCIYTSCITTKRTIDKALLDMSRPTELKQYNNNGKQQQNISSPYQHFHNVVWYEVLNMVNDYDLNIFLCLFTWCIRLGIYIIPCEYINVSPNGGTFKPHCSLDIWILNGKENYFETSIILETHIV